MLEHLLLAAEEFLSPSFLFLPFGLLALPVHLHVLEHRIQLSVPLGGVGLGGFPPGGRRFLTRTRLLLQRRRRLGTRRGPLGEGCAFGDDFRQFLPIHK